MADAIIASLAEMLIITAKQHIESEIQLVRGVEKELRNLSDKLKAIRNVLDDAERRRYKDKGVNDWVVRLEQTSHEMEDVLEEWSYASLQHNIQQHHQLAAHHRKDKVCFPILPSCLCFKKVAFRRDIAVKVQNLKAKLDDILKETDRYEFHEMSQLALSESWRVQSTSRFDSSEVRGRKHDTDLVVRKVMAHHGTHKELGLRVISIVGAGGLGKTTLAQLVYNDSRVKDCFDLRIWVCVSNPFDVVKISQGIIESMGKGRICIISNQLEASLERLEELISGKKFLLVLDDVWTEEYEKWEPLRNALKHGGASSTVLVTTRNEKVAKIMGTMDHDIYRLGLLSDEDCWSLLAYMALPGRNKMEFEEVGKKIARKCNGSPLAAKTLGSLLRFKESIDEWENVFNSEVWGLEEVKEKLFSHMLLSYNELSPMHKRCFSYCASFPKDEKIVVEDLIRRWMALGYLGISGGNLELVGQDGFKNLAMRSLFQDLEKDGQKETFKMHDLIHDFAHRLRNDSRIDQASAETNKTTCQVCDAVIVSHVKAYRSLILDRKSLPSLCDCLTSLRVLGLWNDFPQGMDKLIHLKWLSIDHCVLYNKDLKTICRLYYLQALFIRSCILIEVPKEIGNLIHLRHLDLSNNQELMELSESICGLLELRTLDIEGCISLFRLPEEIHRLKNLKHLHNMYSVMELPQSVAKLTGLRRLSEFNGGSGGSKMGWLKNLNLLSGSLQLKIKLGENDWEDVVEEAREAELKEKKHIQSLRVEFLSESAISSSMNQMVEGVIDALEPHPNLMHLSIFFYDGSRFPGWISSPCNQLRSIALTSFRYASSLPPLGRLPCLEEIDIRDMDSLETVGQELLGIGGVGNDSSCLSPSSSSSPKAVAVFPKLKKLTFKGCENWKEWEDITAEEEGFGQELVMMPCLKELAIRFCSGLAELPHRLLRKALSLEVLDIAGSELLIQRYGDLHASALKSIFRHNIQTR